ncbi:MAG: hypothetical protein P1Q69_05760 [Candidatus Thorarchaeota archaeon]|nr:hypothetical protein [Candidatus Thorarchaeota archaeon]
MRTLTITELEKWYLKQLKEKNKDFRKQAEKSYKIVKQAARDTKGVAEEFVKASQDEDAESQGATSRFANKINTIVANFEIDQEITYAGTEAMQEEIQFFIQEIWGAGARWIRRLDKKHKSSIKQLDVYMKELMSEMKRIGKLLYEYSWLKDLERIHGRIETMQEITYGTELYDQQIRQIKGKIAQAQSEFDTAEAAYTAFRETSNVADLLNLDDESDHIRGLLRMKLNTLKKTVKKFNQTDTGIRISPAGQKALVEYFEDPFIAISAEPVGYPALIEGLDGLQKAIDNGSLSIKDRLARRSIEEIDVIRNGGLKDLHEKALEIEDKKTKYAGSDVYTKNQKLASALDEATKNLEYHWNDLLKIGDDIRREIAKFEDFKSRVASEILEAFGESIEIKVETLGLLPLLEKCKVE